MEKINLVDFQKRKLKRFYLALYVVTKDIKIRTETCIASRKLYVVFGMDIIGDRQILGMYFANDNDNRFWLEKFEDFQARNLEKVVFLVTPPNKNIERCAKIVYNGIRIVHSPDCVTYDIVKFWADHPSRKGQFALKQLFLADDIEHFHVDYDMFKEIYVDNKIVTIMLDNKKGEIEKFYQYNKTLRNLFYPYYTIKEMKKYLNKLKTKEPLCTNMNEVIEFCLPLINSFELGRSYSKKEWLELISSIYDEYKEDLEEYLNG